MLFNYYLISKENMEKPQTRAPLKTKDEIKERVSEKVKASLKPSAKENTKPQEFKLHTEERAIKRAVFNCSVATKLYLIELQKKQEQRLQKIIEEEEIRLLRKEMIPRAQLMPYFDRPFFPQRSKRALTTPREPSFHMMSSKCWCCISNNQLQLYGFQGRQVLNPIK